VPPGAPKPGAEKLAEEESKQPNAHDDQDLHLQYKPHLSAAEAGATTLRHNADPISEVDRRAAAYLSQLTAAPGNVH